jgi:hypothetical protein
VAIAAKPYDKPVTLLFARKLFWDELRTVQNKNFLPMFTRPKCYFGERDFACTFVSPSESKNLLDTSVRVLALGDSWFSYPRPWTVLSTKHNSENLIVGLLQDAKQRRVDGEKIPNIYILNFSNNGEHLSNMSGIMPPDLDARNEVQPLLGQKKDPKKTFPGVFYSFETTLNQAFQDQIVHANALGKPFDAILLSAGGNDFLTTGNFNSQLSSTRFGKILHEAIEESRGCFPVASASEETGSCTPGDIHLLKKVFQSNVKHYMETVLYGQYMHLLSDIHTMSPQSKVIAHNYALPVPRGRGFRIGGLSLLDKNREGWAWKVMEENAIPLEYRRDLTDIMLNEMTNVLNKISNDVNKADEETWFSVVDTAKLYEQRRSIVRDFRTADGEPNDFRMDEIHLNHTGYSILANALLDQLLTVVHRRP